MALIFITWLFCITWIAPINCLVGNAAIISTHNISRYFNEEEYYCVMEEVRKQIQQPFCIDVSIDQNEKFLDFKRPHLNLRLHTLTNSDWKNLISSHPFRFSCMVLYMVDIPTKQELEKLSLLQRKGITLYYVIASKSKKKSLTFLTNKDLEKEKNIVTINKEASDLWVLRTRQIYSPSGFLTMIVSHKWNPLKGFFQNREIFPEQMTNFYQFTLICSTLQYMPFISLETTPGSLYAKPKPSLDFFMLDVIAEKLNFSYKVRMPADGYWGIQKPNVSNFERIFAKVCNFYDRNMYIY